MRKKFDGSIQVRAPWTTSTSAPSTSIFTSGFGACMSSGSLVVIETHPIQYHAPVYRMLQERFSVEVSAIYGSDFSVVGYQDSEFQVRFAWDTDLLSGYKQVFLSRVREGGASNVGQVTCHGLRAALRDAHPGAVMIVGYSSGFHRWAFFQAWRAGYPLLFRAETTDHAHGRTFLRSCIRDTFLRWFYRKFNTLFYIGARSRQHFLRLGCTDKHMVFSPYCVDTSSFLCAEMDRNLLRTDQRCALGIEPSKKVLLFSGKLSVRKGPDILLAAVYALSRAVRSDIVVIFMGDGELRATLQEQANGLWPLDVRFIGFKNQRELSAYYHAADLLVLPSRHSETWGLVVNEALHHGLPVVVSDGVGCCPDLVISGVTGEACKADSVESLALAIQRALQLVGRPEVRAQCRMKVARYSVYKAARGIAHAYSEAAATARSRGGWHANDSSQGWIG